MTQNKTSPTKRRPRPISAKIMEEVKSLIEKRERAAEQTRAAVSQRFDEMQRAFESLGKKAHANVVLLTSAKLSDELQRLLITRMPNISGRLEKKLFEGALESYDAKVHLALAMGLIDADLAHQLVIVGRIRNEFAHSSQELNFDSNSIVTLVRQFRSTTADEAAFRTYARVTKNCLRARAALLSAARKSEGEPAAK